MRNRLTLIAITTIMFCLAILALFLWPDRSEIVQDVMVWAATVGHILLIVIAIAALAGMLVAGLYIVRLVLPLIEHGVDIRHKWILGNREKSDITIRHEISRYGQASGGQIKMQDIHVSHLPLVQAAQVERLPQVRVIESLPSIGTRALALPSPASRKPTIDELVRAVQPNSFTFSLGRSLTTNKLVIVDLSGKHIKVIGATQMGKSCLVASIIEQLRQTHDTNHLHLAILDLEGMAGKLFDGDDHIMMVRTKQGNIKLHAQSPEEVAQHIILLHKLMIARYNQAKQYGWEYIEKLPRIVVYFEEFLYWKKTLAQFVDKQTQEAAIAAITGIATRGLKVKIHLIVAAQVDYADKELKDAMTQFIGVNVSFAVLPTAARAAGFVDSKLISDNFKAKKPGQFVVETIGGSDIGVAPDFDVKARVKALGGRETEEIEMLPSIAQLPEEQQQEDDLDERLQQVLYACQELNTLNKRVIADHTGLSDSTVYRLLQQLKDMGYV